MSCKIKVGLLFDENFMAGIEALNKVKMSNESALKVMKITNTLHEEYLKQDKIRVDVLEMNCKKNNEGKPLIRKGEYVFKDRKNLEAEITKLMSSEVEVDIPSITADDVTELGITPVELQAISMVMPIFHKKGE